MRGKVESCTLPNARVSRSEAYSFQVHVWDVSNYYQFSDAVLDVGVGMVGIMKEIHEGW